MEFAEWWNSEGADEVGNTTSPLFAEAMAKMCHIAYDAGKTFSKPEPQTREKENTAIALMNELAEKCDSEECCNFIDDVYKIRAKWRQ